MKKIKGLINKVKTNIIEAKIKKYITKYPALNIIFNLDFTKMKATLITDNIIEYELKQFDIKTFDWFDVSKLMGIATDLNLEIHINDSDYPALNKFIEKSVYNLCVNNDEYFMGFAVKKYETKEEYKKEIGEFVGVYSKMVSAKTAINIITQSSKAEAATIFFTFKNKSINILNFERKEENKIKEDKGLILSKPVLKLNTSISV